MSTIVTRAGKGSALTNAEIDANVTNLNNDKLEKSGGTMTGDLTLAGAPSSSLHASTKQYVDDHIGDATAAHTASAINLTSTGGLSSTDVQSALIELDTEKLALAGGTMTGNLTLAGAPSSNLHAATKLYVDDHIGDATAAHAASAIANTPAGNIAATTVQAALDELDTEKLALAGGTMTGQLEITPGIAARWTHANALDGNDGKIGAGLFAEGLNIVGVQTVAAAGRRIRMWGDITLVNTLTLAGAPTSNLHAATKLYVDDHINDATAAHAASAISNTAAGGIAATTVQAAIDELDTEKAPKASPTFTGTATAAALTVNSTLTGNAQQQLNTDAPAITYIGPAGQLECKNIGAADADQFAGITFHNSAQYAVNFGLVAGVLRVGGWSMGATSYRILHEGLTAVTLNGLTIPEPYNLTVAQVLYAGSATVTGSVSCGDVLTSGTSASIFTRAINSGSYSSPQSAMQVGISSTQSGGSLAVGGGPSILFFGHDNGSTPAKEFIGRFSGIMESVTTGAISGGLGVYVRANHADSGAATLAATWKASKNLVQEGFTQLGGSGAPAVKMKKLTGTTNAAEGGLTNIAHGLTADKIIGVQALVRQATNNGVLAAHTSYAGYQFDCYWDATNVVIFNHATNSENILSKPICILITYEE